MTTTMLMMLMRMVVVVVVVLMMMMLTMLMLMMMMTMVMVMMMMSASSIHHNHRLLWDITLHRATRRGQTMGPEVTPLLAGSDLAAVDLGSLAGSTPLTL